MSADASAPPPQQPAADATPPDPTAMPHILVVEDEEHLAAGIRYNLEAEGFRVTVAGDGATALKLIEQYARRFQLVILDLMLPRLSGYSVCEALRTAGRELPVLVLSARTLAEDRTRAFDVGADQYLMKPFDLDEFLSRVRNLLSAARRRSQQGLVEEPLAEYRFGDTKINFQTHEVTVRGNPVRMTSLEIKLLKYFVQHAGRVIPRAELLENVWGMSGDAHTRAPDQFIRRLRKAFEKKPSQPRHFLTIRDAGYRFSASGE